MSKNIIIQEGGSGKQFTATKLKTAQVGGGSCYWVPEDETRLTTKTITKDGTYNAATDGYYGYSHVTVRGIGKAVGKATDGSGDEAQVTTDPTTGDLVEKKIPSAIAVTTPPTVAAYNDGDSISYAGMVVKALLKSGAVFSDNNYPNGVIPAGQLILSENTANYADAYEYGAISEHQTGMEQPIQYAVGGPQTAEANFQGSTLRTDYVPDYVRGFFVKLSANSWLYGYCATQPFSVRTTHTRDDGVIDTEETTNSSPYTPSWAAVGATVHWVQIVTQVSAPTDVLHTLPANTGTPTMTDYWVIAYDTYSAGKVKIPVQWESPYDYRMLETNFDITVINT